jgi:hypothetical protein
MSEIINPLSNPLLLQPETNNPYRFGISEIWHQLKWDLNLEAWRSRKKIKEYKNLHKGEKAVIVCNGPSLLKSNLSLLSGIYTFGLNKINLIFDKSSFRPSCIVAVNSLVIQQNSDFFNHTEIPLFLENTGCQYISNYKNAIFLHSSSQPKFAQDCSRAICRGHTVTFVAIQLAFHMGFTKVALIGCDHNFVTNGKANSTMVSSKIDINHFDPNYFAGGVKWQLPDLDNSENNYLMAKNMYEAHGREIFNATEGGKLEIFKRIELQNFINLT